MKVVKRVYQSTSLKIILNPLDLLVPSKQFRTPYMLDHFGHNLIAHRDSLDSLIPSRYDNTYTAILIWHDIYLR